MKKIALLLVFVLIGFAVISCANKPPPAPDPVLEAPPAPPPPAAAPVLGVTLSSRYFSPDGDGVDDSLTISLSCVSEAPVSDWSFDISDPEIPGASFMKWSGTGNPPSSLVWDGKGTSGGLVWSALDYPYTFTAKNNEGRSSSVKGKIETDVLVVREGDTMWVQIHSIMFPPNSSEFNGLEPEISATNDLALRRIAEILNKFSLYKIRVEGHANATAATPALRQREQELELLPLSEKRAKLVVDYLVALGVDRDRFTYVGVGSARPIASYENHDEWWKNRRVEFILIK